MIPNRHQMTSGFAAKRPRIPCGSGTVLPAARRWFPGNRPVLVSD